MILTGLCVSPGTAAGTVTFFSYGRVYGKSDIVVLEQWLTQHVITAKGAGALLAAKGSLTSHASIVARELGIPALVNVDTAKLANGQQVMIDAADERIEAK